MPRSIDFTLVLGVDASHLSLLHLALQSWALKKPSLFRFPWVIFFDAQSTDKDSVQSVVTSVKQKMDVRYVAWPPPGIDYPEDTSSRFGNSQRYKMLSGFVHVPAKYVLTYYWLKLDLDAVAVDNDDWIDLDWFSGFPAIVAQPWPYTKPADQMMKLDKWVAENPNLILSHLETFSPPPLNLIPPPGWSMVRHKRIISWCGFFQTEFTILASDDAKNTIGEGKLPVPSQDGYMWYYARRGGYGIVRTDMKSKGWEHHSRESAVREAVQRLQGE